MRLIDADKLDWWYKGRRIRRVIDEAPTVDAVEVVHGRWTTRTVANWLYEEACSICGFCGCEEFHYCPNCGAKMDGDGNG